MRFSVTGRPLGVAEGGDRFRAGAHDRVMILYQLIVIRLYHIMLY